MATVEQVAQAITRRINEKYSGDIQSYLNIIEYSEHLRTLDGAINTFRGNMGTITIYATEGLNGFIDAYQKGQVDNIPKVISFTEADRQKIVNFVRNAS